MDAQITQNYGDVPSKTGVRTTNNAEKCWNGKINPLAERQLFLFLFLTEHIFTGRKKLKTEAECSTAQSKPLRKRVLNTTETRCLSGLMSG